MEQIYTEASRDIPVMGTYDVVVIGGGIAGVAAAVSAKRAGAQNVLLLEKQYALGGLATLGLVTIYLPLCNGLGRQVSFGLAQELLHVCISRGAEEPLPPEWVKDSGSVKPSDKRYQARFNAALAAIALEQFVQKEGVQILFGVCACAAPVQNGFIDALVFEGKSCRQAVKAGAYIDATGDAHIAMLAGESTVQYAPGNLLAGWYYYLKNGENTLRILGEADLPGELEDPEYFKPRYPSLTDEDTTDFLLKSRAFTLKDYELHGGYSPEHAMTTIPTVPQYRMTRRIEGKTVMKMADEGCNLSDSIGMIGNWRKRGPSYEVPLGALKGNCVNNLWAAGRMVSAEDEMWDQIRVIPACAVTGEAVGIAAVVGDDIKAVQDMLLKRGVPLHL